MEDYQSYLNTGINLDTDTRIQKMLAMIEIYKDSLLKNADFKTINNP